MAVRKKINKFFPKKLVILLSVLWVVLLLSACSSDSKEDTATAEEELFDQSRGQELLVGDSLPDAPEDTTAKGMKEVASNGNFALYLDLATTDIAVQDKRTGIITHSNPVKGIEGYSMEDAQLGIYGAMLEMSFTNLSGKTNRYSSFTDSVLLEQFSYYKIEQGVRVVYTLGVDESRRILPPALSEATYKRILDELNDDEKADFKPLFRLIKTASIPKAERDALLKKYPKLETENLYVLREIKTYEKNLLESILKAHNFTVEDVEAEIEYVGFERDDSNVVFTVPVDLTVDEKGFVASVNCDYIQEPDEYKITELSLLRGFGATNEEEGFILVPDGSGILFDLAGPENNIFSKQLYGADQVITAPFKSGSFMPAIMPVFGIKNSQRAIFAVIEQGAAITNVVARTRSNMTPLACVGIEIVVNAKDFQNYGNLKTNPSGLVLPADEPIAVVSVRYFFMDEEGVDYSQMAALYQNYLIEAGVLSKPQKHNPVTSFYAEMPGAIEKKVSKAGIPINTQFALTSYKQAESLLQMLLDEGVKGLKLRYTGWANNGLHNSVFNEADLISAMGSKKELKELLSFAQTNTIDVFLDAKFDSVYKDKRFDGFEYSEDASRQLDHKVAVTGRYNPASLQMYERGRRYIVSPVKIVQYADSYLGDLKKQGIDAKLSLGTMGRNINSDYRIGETFTRERSEKLYQEAFQKAEQAGGSVLTEQGNAYTWEFVSDIVGLPVGGSELYAQAQAIPFVQMVLHGYIDYSAMPLNLSSDLVYETLKAIETGSGVYVQMMYADDMVVLDTAYDYMYSLNYENQLADAAKVYKDVAAALDQVAGETITKHEKLDDGVYATTYSNKKQIIVNYQNKEWEADGVIVQGRNYTVREVN